MAPSGCGDKSSFHERGKQWKVCAKELITRCICVLFWRGEEGYSSTGPQGKAGALMDGYKHGWIGHVMGSQCGRMRHKENARAPSFSSGALGFIPQLGIRFIGGEESPSDIL
ncbi:selenoprotein e isoform X2 [Gymnodraco acuticeps]|uniref:Selenoprotein e isoform X2 n=1 Tax=Gymnodraco acuticeps TaxID=8218 RepID=A0A6P8UWD1_GYMAC|nr:selenoprotein e isoform X2 [Gymnodraco acuticeps]